jgi:MFS family permease
MGASIVVFYIIAGMALLSIVSVLTIRAEAIDYDRARGLHDGPSASQETPSGLSVLMGSRGLLIFCLCCVIFHLANAAMLPLVGQKLALQDEKQGTALMSGCIVAAQIVMVPMAILVGRKADIWGRKPLFLAGLAILSLRGFLYPLSDDRTWLFAIQSLDGAGAGLYGALFPLIVADLTRGTGHFNLAQGAVITALARRLARPWLGSSLFMRAFPLPFSFWLASRLPDFCFISLACRKRETSTRVRQARSRNEQ